MSNMVMRDLTYSVQERRGQIFGFDTKVEYLGFIAEDIFKTVSSCGIEDSVRLSRLPTLNEAVALMQPCAQDLSHKYHVAVSISRSVMSPGYQYPGRPLGIDIIVSGLLPNSTVLRDLFYSVRKRTGGVFGFGIEVVYGGRSSP